MYGPILFTLLVSLTGCSQFNDKYKLDCWEDGCTIFEIDGNYFDKNFISHDVRYIYFDGKWVVGKNQMIKKEKYFNYYMREGQYYMQNKESKAEFHIQFPGYFVLNTKSDFLKRGMTKKQFLHTCEELNIECNNLRKVSFIDDIRD